MSFVGALSKVSDASFKRPDLLNQFAMTWLNEIFEDYGEALIVTDDGREEGDNPSGAAKKISFHKLGQAFDLRSRTLTKQQRWRFHASVIRVATTLRSQFPAQAGIEFEVVFGPKEQHFHVAFFMDGREDVLINAMD